MQGAPQRAVVLGASPALARHGLVARLALVALILSVLSGCLRLPTATVEAHRPRVAKKSRPLTAKAYYLRMREIGHTNDVLLAADLRRARRIVERGPSAASRREIFAIYAGLGAIEARTEADLKALGPPPREVRALYDLRRREIDRSQAISEPIRRLAERGDYAGFIVAVNRPDPGREGEKRTIAAEERRVRSRLGLGGATASALPEAMALARRPDVPSHRVRFGGNTPKVSAGDRRFVEYCFGLQTAIENSAARMDAFEAEMRAALPRGRAARVAYLWALIDRSRGIDLQSVADIRRLGPPPPAARVWANALIAQARHSAATLAAIRTRIHDPEQGLTLMARLANDPNDPYRRAASREAMAAFRRLEAIKRRSER